MFDEGEFCPRMQLAKVYLIHEGADEKDASSGAAQEVLRGERVGEAGGIEARALVTDAYGEVVGAGLEGGGDSLVGVVGVSVEDGIDGCLADRHDYVGHGVWIEACTQGEVLRCPLHRIDTLNRGTERERDAACSGIGQWSP